MTKETFEYAKMLDRQIKSLERQMRQLSHVKYGRILLLTGFDEPIEVEPDYRAFGDVVDMLLDETRGKIDDLKHELDLVLGKDVIA